MTRVACRPSSTPWVAGSLLGATLLLTLATGLRCVPPRATPFPGVRQHQEPALVPVPGGYVNAAGGNLVLERTDLEIDTRLGPWEVGARYNSVSGAWLWSFDVTCDGETFVDASGAIHALDGVPDGTAIPGSLWVKLGPHRLRTKGGLVHVFDQASGRLLEVHWASSQHPKLTFVQAPVAGAPRTVAIEQCTTSGCAGVFELGYDPQGRLVSAEDRAGRRAEFGYDAAGRLTRARDALDLDRGWPGFRYEYDALDLVAVTSSEGERVEFGYAGDRHQVISVRAVGAGNPVSFFAYGPGADGLYDTTVTDPLGHRTRYRHDDLGRVHEVEVEIDPSEGIAELTRFEWSGRRVSRETRPDGSTLIAEYEDDDPVRVTQPSGNVVRISYASAGVDRSHPEARPVLSVRDDLGIVESRSYDAQGRLVSQTNGADETTTFGYDADEMLATVVDPAGVVTTFTGHGEHGHPTSVQKGGLPLEYAYDAVGNLTRGFDPSPAVGTGLGGVVSRGFDADRNVAFLELDDMEGNWYETPTRILAISYRSDGRPLAIERPYGGDTQFVYDPLGRLVARREKASGVGHAEWQETSFGYDGLGRLTSLDRPNGMQESWRYDPAGRVLERAAWRDGVLESQLTSTYEGGRLVAALDAVHGAPEHFGYDAAGRLQTETFPAGERLVHLYDDRSRRVASIFVAASGSWLRTLGFGYDGADRPVWISEDGEPLLTRTYADGRLETVAYRNGLVRSFQYDANGFLDASETRLGATPVETSDVDVLANGWFDATVRASTETYGALPVVTSESVGLEPDPRESLPASDAGRRVFLLGDPPYIFQYDELSNIRAVLGSTSYVYNAERNRLLRAEGPSQTLHTYAYDAAGFVVRRDDVPLDWTATGRIRSIGTDTSFVWDARGRPVSRSVASDVRRWLFGGRVEADAAGNPLALDLGEVRLDLVSDTHLYRHYDHRGNVKFTSDDAGEVVAHYAYTPYALLAAHGDPGAHEENASFARGVEYAGLLQLGVRLYDPDARRFLSPDPIHQVINQYGYTLGNPVWFWDPGGAIPDVIDLGDVQVGGVKLRDVSVASVEFQVSIPVFLFTRVKIGPKVIVRDPSPALVLWKLWMQSSGPAFDFDLEGIGDIGGSVDPGLPVGCTAGHSGVLTISFAPLGRLAVPRLDPLCFTFAPLALLLGLRVAGEMRRERRLAQA